MSQSCQILALQGLYWSLCKRVLSGCSCSSIGYVVSAGAGIMQRSPRLVSPVILLCAACWSSWCAVLNHISVNLSFSSFKPSECTKCKLKECPVFVQDVVLSRFLHWLLWMPRLDWFSFSGLVCALFLQPPVSESESCDAGHLFSLYGGELCGVFGIVKRHYWAYG